MDRPQSRHISLIKLSNINYLHRLDLSKYSSNVQIAFYCMKYLKETGKIKISVIAKH